MIYLKRKSPSDPRLEVAILFPFHIFGSFNLLLDQQFALNSWHRVSDINQICAGEMGEHHLRNATGAAKRLPPRIAADVWPDL